MRRVFAMILGSLVAGSALCGQGHADPTGISREGGTLVPEEEYPVFDRVVESKFLTPPTRIVLIERSTVPRLHPELPATPTPQWFEETRPFDGRLPADLVRDFVAKNQAPARLEGRFRLGVSVRFVTPDGTVEPEVRLLPNIGTPDARLVQRGPQALVPIVDRLGFSRVGFTLREDQALVYVVNERPDGTGAGFLFWVHREGGRWAIIDTETLWVAHPDAAEAVGLE